MSLSTSEQRALDSIKDGLASSDPQLIALLTTFTRMASSEEMPAREEIRQTMCPPARPAYQRLGLQRAVLSLWLLIAVVLIPVALILSHGGSQETCTGSLVTSCPNSTHAPSSRPASATLPRIR